MGLRGDHQLLEADKLLFGERIARALKRENMTVRRPAKRARLRVGAIVARAAIGGDAR